MVLGAGFGTRLRPLTDELPKPLLPIGDRSLLEHAISAFRGAGLGASLVVNVHHLAHEFARRLPFSAAVKLVLEPEIRGTAGGIAGARSELGPAPVVVMIGDVVLDHVPAGFAEAAQAGGLVLAALPRPRGSGSVGVGAEGQLVRLRGERFGEEVAGGEYVGLAALGERALAALPERGCLFADYALPALRAGARIAIFPYLGSALFPGDDLPGLLASYLAWLDANQLNSYVGPGAEVEVGVELERSLVGAGARIEGRGRVARALVLPHAACRAPLSDVIVAPSGLVINISKNE
jgi:mannose-1-phosphate guanylyltransferase